MSRFILSVLRDVVFICEKDNKYFIGNENIKVFNSKKEIGDFKRTKQFKFLDKAIPLVWHIVEVNKDE